VSAPNVILFARGKALTTDKEKARAFQCVYAKVSSNVENRRDSRGRLDELGYRSHRSLFRKRRIELKSFKSAVVPPGQQQLPFSMAELDKALSDSALNKAPGEDSIHNEMIVALNKQNRLALLKVYNQSWEAGDVPQSWKVATIFPLPKPGKDPTKLDSYRPISLTNVRAKIMERMVTTRLQYDLEGVGVMSPNQSGFRPGRCASDVLQRLTSDVHSGFHKRPFKRTVSALIDYSRAFDKVNHQLLLQIMAASAVHQVVHPIPLQQIVRSSFRSKCHWQGPARKRGPSGIGKWSDII
jgi:hypothetical protein